MKKSTGRSKDVRDPHEIGESIKSSIQHNMKDPEYRKEYDALEDEFRLIELMISLRREKKLTQAQLAKKVGMKQAAIARLESGKANPSFKTLNRVAKALDKKITFV